MNPADGPRALEPDPGRSERGARASQISREIVQLHARMFGRGPTRAKTYIHDDYVLCLLEDVFTPAERTLVDAGSIEQVVATRRAFGEAVASDFIAIVEGAVGRSVRAFVSQVHIDPEISVELFLLEPTDEPIEPEEEGGADSVG